jgi:hypothetical protein
MVIVLDHPSRRIMGLAEGSAKPARNLGKLDVSAPIVLSIAWYVQTV